VDAILLPWQGGQESGNAVADVLTGKVNPSGKLPTTMPVAYATVPTAKNFPGIEIGEMVVQNSLFRATPSRVTYEEGIYIGYRYYSTFGKEIAYPFGYGLSYTSFDLTESTFAATDGTIDMTVAVKNTGKVAGREIVQVYITAPSGKLEKPALELRGFEKTSQLEPGQAEELKFSLKPGDYASFDEVRSAWIVEPGEYEIKVGTSSRDILITKKFTIKEEIVVEKVSASLRPLMELNELKVN
jgi:beta-glucosidase